MAQLVVGRYKFRRSLGSGARSDVWLADDLDAGHPVTVVRLKSSETNGLEPALVERMIGEARAAARLEHPNIVSLRDIVHEDTHDDPILVLDYVKGESLAKRIQRLGRLPLAEAAQLIGQIGSALAAAHRVGVVHGDVRPENILIDSDGVARLAGFGVARGMRDAAVNESGELAGNVSYIAPEVARTRAASAPSDVWSLGASLYAAIEGHAPFAADGERQPEKLISRAANQATPLPENAEGLTTLIERTLAKQPSARLMAIQVADRLHAWAANNNAAMALAVAAPSAGAAQDEDASTAALPSAADDDAAPPATAAIPAALAAKKPPAKDEKRKKSLVWPSIALVLSAALVVAVLVFTNGNGDGNDKGTATGNTSSTSAASSAPSSLSAAPVDVQTPTHSCTGLSCTWSLAGWEPGDQISWNFGDGSPTRTGTQINHTYLKPGSYTVTVSIMRDGATGHSQPVTLSFAQWARKVTLVAGDAGSFTVSASVSSVDQCRTGKYTLQRNDGGWTNVSSDYLNSGQTVITTPTVGDYRIVVDQLVRSGGVCGQGTSNTVTVAPAPYTPPPDTGTGTTTFTPPPVTSISAHP